jgi:hypothetical protein
MELGAGIGVLADICPTVEPTDIVPTPWASVNVDPESLPYAEGSIANLVLSTSSTISHVPWPFSTKRSAFSPWEDA